jgi:threonine synthase
MKYISTRGNHPAVDSAFAIRHGMVPGGGLFVPESMPSFELGFPIGSYDSLALSMMSLFLTDFSSKEIADFVGKAYTEEKFESVNVAPLVDIGNDNYALELWHGPTAAFKDFALQILPYLLSGAAKKERSNNEIVILVATSGDTGKAALEGFKDVPGTRVVVFYPKNGVSHIQEKQMLTTGGKNTHVVGVTGNFDDCQAMVKELFADEDLAATLMSRGKELTSANSINWGRLVPQIVYYFYSYQKMVQAGSIAQGDLLNYVVPTGNFGNILAGYYAKLMGLPIGKLVCASNRNKVLHDFFQTGTYHLDRKFFKTSSPSMDILVSSNLERFLFDIVDQDGLVIAGFYNELLTNGKFSIGDVYREKISSYIISGFAEEADVRDQIRDVHSKTHYLIDTHTAVAVHVANELKASGQISGPTIIISTASAYKFSQAVFDALTGEGRADDEFGLLEALQEITGSTIHRSLKGLEKLNNCTETIIDKENGKQTLLNILGV